MYSAFDSAIFSTPMSGGFIMARDTRMSFSLFIREHEIDVFARQDEAHPDTHVPLFGNELRLV